VSTEEKHIHALSTEHLKADLKGHSVRGGLLTLASQGTQFFTSLAMTVVLAHLLTPVDFGLVAMVTAITGLGQAFADLGLSEATIQHPDITHDQVSVLFWINLAIGLGLTLITAALAPILAWFYHEPRLIAITLISSPIFVIGGLRVQPDALLKRQMRFKSVAARDIAGCVLGVLISIGMALCGAGYWAIVAYPIVTNLNCMALSWLMVTWRPRLFNRGIEIRSLVTFGGGVAASYLIDSLKNNFSNIAIGWYWGAGPLGLFTRAYTLLMRPLNQLIGPAQGVAVPAFSKLHDDPDRFARYYLRTVSLIMWFGAPIFGFLFAAAGPVIILLLGHKWIGSLRVFQLLAVSAIPLLLLQSSGWVLVSRGQSGRLLKLTLVLSAAMIGSVFVGLPFGIDGVAFCYSITLLVTLPWALRLTFRDTNLTLRRLARALLCPTSVSLVGVFFAEASLHMVAPQRAVSALLTVMLSFATTYSASALIPKVREEVLSFQDLLGVLGWPKRALEVSSL
jgi:O-antigen/teichoic acid export membrane protein